MSMVRLVWIILLLLVAFSIVGTMDFKEEVANAKKSGQHEVLKLVCERTLLDPTGGGRVAGSNLAAQQLIVYQQEEVLGSPHLSALSCFMLSQ